MFFGISDTRKELNNKGTKRERPNILKDAERAGLKVPVNAKSSKE